MVKSQHLLLILGMGLVTYIPRWFPLFFLTKRRLPGWFIEWLDLIPVAILSALVLPDLIIAEGPHRLIKLIQVKSLVAMPTFLVASKTRSLGGTVIAGMVLFWLAGKLFQG